MRILRIALRNYRGVSDRTVEFAPGGVTIVEGPNEIGKSSIAEAIDRIIEDLDSTSKQRIQAVKPVDRDVGPEVTIEAETGPYAFRYKKRFLRDRVTELEITRPRPENHTGREAHERVQAILSETVDMALWKALRMQQGDVVGQAPLADQTSLSAALDRSAGESPAGDEEVTLFGLAHAEYLQYWTETGRRKQVVAEMERTIEGAAQRIAGIEDAIRAIEADVEASVRLEGEARRLVERGAEQRSRLGEHQARVDALAKLEAGVATIQAKFGSAQLAANETRRVGKARQDAISAVATAKSDQERLDAAVREDGPQLEVAQARVAAADTAVAAARLEREVARALADERQARLSQLRDAADLASLLERSERVKAALVALEAAAADAALPVDTALLASIREQHRTVELARARLEATRPLVRVEAFTDLVGLVDGLELKLPAGTRLERRVDQSIEITLPDMASVSVEVGAAGDMTSTELEAAEGQLGDLLRAAGATDLAEAERLHWSREDAGRTVTEQKRGLRENLRDLTLEALEERIASLRGRMPEAEESHTGAGNEDDVRRSAEEAQRALSETEPSARAAEQEWEGARTRLAEIEIARSERNTELRLATEEFERREAALAAERAAASDESLAKSLRMAEGAEETLGAELDGAKTELAREGADQAREMLDNARRALERVDAETRQVQDELLQVTTRLRDHGEDGLAEDLQEAQADKDQAEPDLRRYQAHAAARKLLFETLRSEREAARRSYVAPLRREIENLGKIVFGPDFAVELDDLNLSVVSRTLQGRTIPYGSLSVGAQEQIALISRLACATIVAPDGGVPVILDDALGNSDPQRLEAMGAVLAVAGRQSQIIVLTCQPDRYEHVGGAHVVRLS
ncbi:MAG: AAA family ATPase [Chloroflexi bacterium]|nr:AAA family ATPase [Chloroflexota bacterium]